MNHKWQSEPRKLFSQWRVDNCIAGENTCIEQNITAQSLKETWFIRLKNMDPKKVILHAYKNTGEVYIEFPRVEDNVVLRKRTDL